MIVKCPHCKNEFEMNNKKETVFCLHCGNKIFMKYVFYKEDENNDELEVDMNIQKKLSDKTYKSDEDPIHENSSRENADVELGASSKKIDSNLGESDKSSNQNGSVGCGIVIILIIILIIIGGKQSLEDDKESEKIAFQQQMEQNPSTWTQEQKDRYNNFTEWLGKQE